MVSLNGGGGLDPCPLGRDCLPQGRRVQYLKLAMFRLVPMPAAPARAPSLNGARRCDGLLTGPKSEQGLGKRIDKFDPCRGTVPKLVLGHQQKAMFRLVPVHQVRNGAKDINLL